MLGFLLSCGSCHVLSPPVSLSFHYIKRGYTKAGLTGCPFAQPHKYLRCSNLSNCKCAAKIEIATSSPLRDFVQTPDGGSSSSRKRGILHALVNKQQTWFIMDHPHGPRPMSLYLFANHDFQYIIHEILFVCNQPIF